VGGQRVDEVLRLTWTRLVLEIVKILVEGLQLERTNELAQPRHHECALGIRQGDAGLGIDARLDTCELALAEGNFARIHEHIAQYCPRPSPGAPEDAAPWPPRCRPRSRCHRAAKSPRRLRPARRQSCPFHCLDFLNVRPDQTECRGEPAFARPNPPPAPGW